MYTSTTLDSLHHTHTTTRSSVMSDHASEHSNWSAPDADHDQLHAYEPTLQPEDEEPEDG